MRLRELGLQPSVRVDAEVRRRALGQHIDGLRVRVLFCDPAESPLEARHGLPRSAVHRVGEHDGRQNGDAHGPAIVLERRDPRIDHVALPGVPQLDRLRGDGDGVVLPRPCDCLVEVVRHRRAVLIADLRGRGSGVFVRGRRRGLG